MLIVCPFPVGVAAGQRLKYEQYLEDWRAAGWDITVSPYMDMATWKIAYAPGGYASKAFGLLKGHMRRMRDVLRIGSFDLVYIHMWVTPLGTSAFERLTRKLARKLVLDVEDNVLVGQGLSRKDNPNYWANLLKGPGKARFLIRTADHVITSSPFLNETCKAINLKRACTYISSSVDTDRFLPVNSYTGTRNVTIGWTGTHSTRVMLDLLRGVFQKLATRIPFKLKVIGNFDYELPGVDLEVVRWTAEREVADLQTFDIGVYPLPLDEWVTGKSGLKAIQYMAFAIPPVATNIGTSPMIIRHGENGMLVRTEDEWLDALETLVKQPELRRRLGEAARRDAVQKYSTKAIAGEYRRILESVTG
jgi:glycosyltransferase involved in cell wall biosynthesis